ncbi:MAG TPA: hypothetical protein PJ986_12485 [Gammaproteobacteria bacterium]|nr:hypothetical protein [Gammaproteobacteria bacterium]
MSAPPLVPRWWHVTDGKPDVLKALDTLACRLDALGSLLYATDCIRNPEGIVLETGLMLSELGEQVAAFSMEISGVIGLQVSETADAEVEA